MSQARKKQTIPQSSGRFYLLMLFLLCAFVAMFARAVYLQVDEAKMLIEKADQVSLRNEQIVLPRGIIFDRNGEELAVSIPVKSAYMDMTQVMKKSPTLAEANWEKLAAMLGKSAKQFKQWIVENKNSQFVWVARYLDPKQANLLEKLQLPGVYLRDEFRRYYPAAESSAHLIGFTNVDDQGIEGLEKAYDDHLSARIGKEKVRIDARQRIIEAQQTIESYEKGQDLYLSIDSRIQTIAYRALKTAVLKHRAKSGSLVIIDVQTGEILSLVSQPSYNPNRLDSRLPQYTRNSAFVDSFEPGSTAKPFTITSALEAGIVNPASKINTAPGRMKLNGYWIKETNGKNYGVLDVAGILKKSSNIGVTKLARMMNDDEFLYAFRQVGFGDYTGVSFPGESSGRLTIRDNWSDIEKANLSFGYGFSVTPVQLAQAYAVLGAYGIKRPLSLLKQQQTPNGEKVLSPKVVRQVVAMMETVVAEGGTGQRAQVEAYRIAGKTGTARKAGKGGYSDDYAAFFAGIAPVSDPKIAMVVFVDEPQSDEFYGGQVAAPVFASVTAEALRLLNVKPDRLQSVAWTDKKHGGHDG